MKEWDPQCFARKCRMPPSVSRDGQHLCRYHHGQDMKNWDSITQAIEENQDLIKFVKKLTHKGEWDKKTRFRYQRWAACPMKPDEPPSIWLHRVHQYINQTIEARASELIQGKI